MGFKPKIPFLMFIWLTSSLLFGSTDESLYFLGTDIDTLTANEGRPEYPHLMPNISEDYKDINPDYTLGEFLSTKPGFFMEKGEGESTLYLRGIQNGALILYNGVPITNDLTKNFNIIDGELSLSGINNVEVIRGASSTLWGPDAFGGIVNLVPKSGGDIDGMKFSTGVNSGNEKKISFNAGKKQANIEYALSGAFTEFSNYNHNGSTDANLSANIKFKDFFNIDYLFMKNNRHFYYKHPDNNYEWDSANDKRIDLLKAELYRKNNDFYSGFTAYFYKIDAELNDMIRNWVQDVKVYSIDYRFDRSIFERKGLFSIGVGYKENIISDSNINNRGFPPDYAEAEESIFKPLTQVISTSTRTKTFFSQYQHHFKKADILFSIRKDFHSFYGNYLNYNTSVKFKTSLRSFIKFSVGTAYRTPYASFLSDEREPKPEKITSYNLEFSYKFTDSLNVSLTPFYNEVENYVNEDPYGGISQYGNFKSIGTEFNLNFKTGDFVSGLNLTFQNLWNNREKYRTLDYILILPDGTSEYLYSNLEKDIHSGPKLFGNFFINWKLGQKTEIYTRMNYADMRRYEVLPSKIVYTFDDAFFVDVGVRFKKIYGNFDVDIYVKDIFDSRGSSMGKVSSVESEGRYYGITISYRF